MNDTLTPELIEKTKAKLSFPDKLFIGGNYANSLTGKTFNNISPIDGKNINDVTFSQKEDIDAAVKIARKTFDSGVWSKSDPSFRKKILLKFADLLEKHHLELALLDTIDMGKTISDTYNADVPGSVDTIRW